MKTNHLASFVAAFGLLAFAPAGGAGKDKPVDSTPPPANDGAAPPAAAPEVASPWNELKGYTYDQRDLFLAGLTGLEARVDEVISELAAKRAAMDANNTSTKAWDFAMQEMDRARTNLKSISAEMAKATRETWDQQKDNVGLAWVRAQDAYAKVKSSTTN